MKRDLVQTLKALYDSEINVTITTLWDGGYDVGLCSPMEWEEAWLAKFRNGRQLEDVADVLHETALAECPESDYARKYGPAAAGPIRVK